MGSLKFIGVVWASMALLCADPLPGKGYLVGIGPTLLRLREPAARLDPATALPPLQMTDDATNAPAITIPSVQVEQPDDAHVEHKANVESEVQPPPSESVIPVEPVQPILTPPVYVQYLDRSTNRGDAIISAPVQFYPPPPPISRGSSAIYVSQ